MANIIEKEETGSTSTDAKVLAESGAEHMTVVWAHRQTAGRGRHERQWISYEGNVFWSAVIRPEPHWPNHGNLVFVNALAVHRTISDEINHSADLQLKWPNDVLLGGKKVSGSLLEAGGGFIDRHPRWVVIGIGINVVDHPEGADMRYPPTSLRAAGFPSTSRERLITALARNLQTEIDIWIQSGFASVRQRYLKIAYGMNTQIRVGLSMNKDDYKDGIYRGIDQDGYLLLERDGGYIEKLDTGDVILRVA